MTTLMKTEKQRLAKNKRQKEQRKLRLDSSQGPIEGKACEICGRTRIVKHRDHDHQTGLSRGLLCQRCNMALGLFDDSGSILKNAIKYLQRYNTNDRMRHRRLKKADDPITRSSTVGDSYPLPSS